MSLDMYPIPRRSVGRIQETFTHVTVEWIIDNFYERYHSRIVNLCSPRFYLSNDGWFLSLMKNTVTCETKHNQISVYLNKENYDTKSNRIAYKIGTKRHDGVIFACIEKTDTFSNEKRGFPISFDEDEYVSKEGEHLKGKSLTIFCEAIILDKCEEKLEQEKSLKGLGKNLKDLFLAGTGCDVKIKVEETTFEAHRIILESRSSVFAAMFQNDMVEKLSGVVDIANCKPEIFRIFLLFLYSGEVEELSNSNVIGLYELSDKYCVTDLKTQCTEFMRRDISIDTFCDFIFLAENHQETGLRNAAEEFFVNNAKDILSTVKWDFFIIKHPELANELFKKTLNVVS